MATIPPDLVEQFARGNGVLIVGTGLARTAGLPGWAELFELLADRIGLPPERRSDPLKVAQYTETEIGRPALIEHVQVQIDRPSVMPTDAHRQLARLGAQTWVVTGYDDLPERAVRDRGERTVEVVRDQNLPYASSEAVTILKLHGDVQQPDTLVLTRSDYDSYFHRFPHIREKLASLLLEKTCLFVGYDVDDPDFNQLCATLTYDLQNHKRLAYALFASLDRFSLADLRQRQISAVNLEADSAMVARERMEQWLAELNQRVDEARSRALRSTAPRPTSIITNLLPLRSKPIGRDLELAQLRTYLIERASPIVIEGASGMGKSSLAHAATYALLNENQFDAIIWWSAKYQPKPLAELLDLIGRLLGGGGEGGQSFYGGEEGAYRLLGQQRVLLVVTKVTAMNNGAILKFLRDVPPTTCVLLTTTSPLPFGTHISIGPLADNAAFDLIRQRAARLNCVSLLRLGEDRLKTLVEASGGLPTALALAVGLVKTGIHLDTIIRRLETGEGDFAVLCANAYARLSQPARDVLNVICLSRDTISAEALERVTQHNRAELEDQLLPQLSDMALVVEQVNEVWSTSRFGPTSRLVRDYYRTRIQRKHEDDDQRWRAALADYYFTLAQAHGYENWSGYDLLEQNLSELLATLDWYEAQDKRRFVDLTKALYYFMSIRGYWRPRLDYGLRASEAARALDDQQSEAEILARVVGRTEYQIGQIAAAEEHLRQALKLFTALSDQGGMASCCRYLGTLERSRDHFEQSLAFYEQAREHAAQSPDRERLMAGIQVSVSTLYYRTHRLDECEQNLREALATFTRLDHQPRIAEVLSRLGDVALQQQRFDEAAQFYRQSDAIALQVKRHKTRGYNLLGLARMAKQRGDQAAAMALAREARQVFGTLGIQGESVELDDLSGMSAG